MMTLKKIFFCAFLTLIFFGFFIICSEVLLYQVYKHVPAKELFSSKANYYTVEWEKKYDCTIFNSIIPHPALGFIHGQPEGESEKCKGKIANNIGINSEDDLPLVKQKNEFRIFLLGGSVANLLGNYKSKFSNRPYLEYYLNQNYISPNGRPFVISNGAVSDWAFPNPDHMLHTYYNLIDGVITLGGYNDAKKIKYESDDLMTLDLQYYAQLPKNSFASHYLNFWVSYKNFMTNSFLGNFRSTYALSQIANGVFQKYFLTKKRISNQDKKINQQKVLDNYESYLREIHQFSKNNKILSASFLQPNLHRGKVLTDREKNYLDDVPVEILDKVESVYRKLENEKYPIRNLSHAFESQKETIYADNIHYENSNGHSTGNEIIVEEIAKKLAVVWNLKKK